jgi:two-component system cell cycle response regulator DivK
VQDAVDGVLRSRSDKMGPSTLAPYVLVVDDFRDGREMLSEYLTFRGIAVSTAADGEEALATAFNRPPTVVVMDLTMPGLDGWEATRRLKADIRTKDVIVIAVTANALVPNETKAREAGADAFVCKPYELPVFADALLSILTNGRPALKSLDALAGPLTSSTA